MDLSHETSVINTSYRTVKSPLFDRSYRIMVRSINTKISLKLIEETQINRIAQQLTKRLTDTTLIFNKVKIYR